MITQLNRGFCAAWQFHIIWFSNCQQRQLAVCSHVLKSLISLLHQATNSTPSPPRKLVASTDKNYLTFSPQGMLAFLHLHSVFLSEEDLLLIQGQFFSSALDSISIRLLQNVMELSLTLDSQFLFDSLMFKHTLVFFIIKMNLIPTFPSNNYKVLITTTPIYLSLSIF